MADADDLAIRSLLTRAISAWQAQWRLVAVAIALDAAPQIAFEIMPGDWTRTSAFFGLFTLYLQLLLTIRTTALTGDRPSGYSKDRWTEGRYPGSFLLALLTLLGILAGFLLLIVPGLLLLTLWSLALPALVAERLGAKEAMRRSWRLVRPRIGWLAAINTLWLTPYILVIGAISAAAYAAEGESPFLLAALNLAISALLMTGAVFWAVVYSAACDVEAAGMSA